jgi:hypothetical protein
VTFFLGRVFPPFHVEILHTNDFSKMCSLRLLRAIFTNTVNMIIPEINFIYYWISRINITHSLYTDISSRRHVMPTSLPTFLRTSLIFSSESNTKLTEQQADLFVPEYGYRTFLRNVGKLDYTASHLGRCYRTLSVPVTKVYFVSLCSSFREGGPAVVSGTVSSIVSWYTFSHLCFLPLDAKEK